MERARGECEARHFEGGRNDGNYGQYRSRHIVEKDGKKRTCRSHLDRWLGEVLGVRGLPIPYGAPNATPHVERLVRTLREEALDHFIFLSVGHIRRVLWEFVRHYNGGRPSLRSTGSRRPTRSCRSRRRRTESLWRCRCLAA